MVLVDYAAVCDGLAYGDVPDFVIEGGGFVGVLRNVLALEYEARVEHAPPLVPVREVADEARLREVLVYGLLHRPVDVFYVREVRDGVERAERLRNVEHIAGVEELVLVVPPEVAALAAEVAPLVFFLHYLAGVFHLEIDNLLPAVKAEHEVRAGVDVYAEDLLDVRARFGFVVETHGARAQAAAHEVGARAHCGVEVLEEVRAEFARLRNRMDFKRDFRYDAQSALAAKEHHCQVGAGSVARDREGINDFARRGDDFEAHYHVLDFAPLGGEHAGAAVGEESAYGRAGDGGGQVHRRIAALVDRPFEVAGDNARFGGDGERLLVDFDDLVHALCVEHDAPEYGERPALRTRTAAPGDDGNLVLVGDFNHLRHFLGASGVDDEIGLLGFLAAVVPHFGNPIVVDGMAELVGIPRVHVFCPHGVFKLRTDHFKHVVAF